MIPKHQRDRRNKQQGFTLTELLVAMAMVGIVMAAVYSTYKSQQDTYVAQEQVAEMQQNLRASLYQMARDLRMAGFNPQRSPDVGAFVTRLVSDERTDGEITQTNETHVAFYIDQNSNGEIDLDDDDEQIAYRLKNNTLEKFRVSDDEWYAVADNIDDGGLGFIYRGPGPAFEDITDEVRDTPDTIYGVTNLPYIESIRSVEISIVARTKEKDRSLDDYRRRTLTTTILCRNMGT